jgi:hypothetical protein
MPANAGIHVLDIARKEDVDARHISAFTRVFDALWPGMTKERITPGRVD